MLLTHPFIVTGLILLAIVVIGLVAMYIRGENATANRERQDAEDQGKIMRLAVQRSIDNR